MASERTRETTARRAATPRSPAATAGALVLLPIDPQRVHAYWEVGEASVEEALGRIGDAKADLVIRIHPRSTVHWDETYRTQHFDVVIDSREGRRYLNLWETGLVLEAELGVRSGAGEFVPVLRASPVELPRGAESEIYEDRRATVAAASSWKPRSWEAATPAGPRRGEGEGPVEPPARVDRPAKGEGPAEPPVRVDRPAKGEGPAEPPVRVDRPAEGEAPDRPEHPGDRPVTPAPVPIPDPPRASDDVEEVVRPSALPPELARQAEQRARRAVIVATDDEIRVAEAALSSFDDFGPAVRTEAEEQAAADREAAERPAPPDRTFSSWDLSSWALHERQAARPGESVDLVLRGKAPAGTEVFVAKTIVQPRPDGSFELRVTLPAGSTLEVAHTDPRGRD